MNRNEKKHDNILEALRVIHLNKETVPATTIWKQNLMRKIRHLEETRSQQITGYSIDVLVWRFSLAIFVIALLFAFYSLTSEILPNTEIASLFLQDIEGKFLYQPLVSLALL